MTGYDLYIWKWNWHSSKIVYHWGVSICIQIKSSSNIYYPLLCQLFAQYVWYTRYIHNYSYNCWECAKMNFWEECLNTQISTVGCKISIIIFIAHMWTIIPPSYKHLNVGLLKILNQFDIEKHKYLTRYSMLSVEHD